MSWHYASIYALPQFESAEWATGFEKDEIRRDVSREVSNEVVYNETFRESVSDTFKLRTKILQRMLFQLLWYQKPVWKFFVVRNSNIKKKNAKIVQVEEKEPERVKGCEKLELSWRRTSTNVSLLQIKICNWTVRICWYKNGSSVLSGKGGGQVCSAGETAVWVHFTVDSAEMLTLFYSIV